MNRSRLRTGLPTFVAAFVPAALSLGLLIRTEATVHAPRPFIPVRSLGLPGFVQRFYEDTRPHPAGLVVTEETAALETISEHTLEFHARDEGELANITLAARSLDGVIVPAGAEFSYNATVGERTEERGFREGLMFSGGRVVSGIGGGVCIPSTALYNVALTAGFEILERHHHSGPVSYAEPGLDAAVVFGLKDFRFRNTLPGAVRISASLGDGTLTVTLSGTPVPGRRVEIERVGFVTLAPAERTVEAGETPDGEPAEIEEQAGRAGYQVTVVRRIYDGRRLVRTETISRDYVAPLDRVVRAETMEEKETGEGSPPEPEAAVPAAVETAEPAPALAAAPDPSPEQAVPTPEPKPSPREPAVQKTVSPDAPAPKTSGIPSSAAPQPETATAEPAGP